MPVNNDTSPPTDIRSLQLYSHLTAELRLAKARSLFNQGVFGDEPDQAAEDPAVYGSVDKREGEVKGNVSAGPPGESREAGIKREEETRQEQRSSMATLWRILPLYTVCVIIVVGALFMPWTPRATSKPDDEPVVIIAANQRTKRFHNAKCKYYRMGTVFFHSRKAAEMDNYVPCGHCGG